LIVRAWTEPGPFQYVGKHYHFNYVNPWPRPWQAPHPPIWIPSQGSGSTIRWAAQMRYTYAQTLSPIAVEARFFQLYREEAEKVGYQASPDQLAWSNTIYVADTDEKAMREARPHVEALANRFLKMPAEMLLPPGYSNIDSIKRIRAAKITGKPQSLDDLVKNGVVIVGSPGTVREKLAAYQDLAGFNTSLTKAQFGTLPDDMTRANMAGIAEEIIPQFRDRVPEEQQPAAAEQPTTRGTNHFYRSRAKLYRPRAKLRPTLHSCRTADTDKGTPCSRDTTVGIESKGLNFLLSELVDSPPAR